MTNTHEACLCVIDSEDKFYTLKRQSVLNLRCDDKLPKTFLWKLPKNFLGTKHRHNTIFSFVHFSSYFQLTNATMARASFGRQNLAITKLDREDRCLQTKIIGTPTGRRPLGLANLFPIFNISTFHIYNFGAPHPEVDIIDRTLVHTKHFCPSFFFFFRQQFTLQRWNPTKTKLSSCSQTKLLVQN